MTLRSVRIALISAIAGIAGGAEAAPKATGNVLLTCENNLQQTFTVSYLPASNDFQFAAKAPGKLPFLMRSALPHVTIDDEDEFAQSYFFDDGARRVVFQYILDREDYELSGLFAGSATDMDSYARAGMYVKANRETRWTFRPCKSFSYNRQFKAPGKMRTPLNSRSEFARRYGAEWAP